MDEQCKAALELLVQNGYLESVKGKYRCTAKLNDAIKRIDDVVASSITITDDWEGLYVQFIREANVPKKGESGTGDLYDLNKYSVEGMKKFRQMLEREGIKYDLLVKVAKAYYSGASRYKKKIGNYITEGLWRMDYMVLKDQNPEQQQQTLQKQLNESETFTRDRIG